MTDTLPILAARSFLIDVAATRAGNDPIFALSAEARRRAAAGESIVDATLGALSTDEGRLAVLPTVLRALREVPAERAAGYAPIAGAPEFVEAVVADLFADAPELGAQSVAVATPGATGALHHALMNFLEPGEALLVPAYFWGPYSTIAQHTRRAVETFRTFDEEGGFDRRAFEAALAALVARQGRALVVLNQPCNNPTGYSLDADEWRAVAEIVARHAEKAPVTLLLDLAYAAYGRSESSAWLDAVRTCAGPALVLTAWTASKSLALYGARVGALVATHPDDEVRRRVANALAYSCRGTWSNCNHLGMLAVARLLTEPELVERVARERAELAGLLGRRVDAFNRAAREVGLEYPRYEGGFFVTVFTPDAARAAATMRAEGVYVVPLVGPDVSALRVALCATPQAAIPRLVESLVRGTAAGRG